MIPDRQEFAGLGFRQLVAYIEARGVTEFDRLDPAHPDDFYDWLAIVERFTGQLVRHCQELAEDELRNCVRLADNIFRRVETYGEDLRRKMLETRFNLSASLMLSLSPRPGIPFLNPAELLRDYLAELPMTLAEARQKAPRWQVLDIAELRRLHDAKSLMIPLKRVDHLFPESADLDEYNKWKALWPELP